MSKREISNDELIDILNKNETKLYTVTENKKVWSDRKTRTEIIAGLLRNRVMTRTFFYFGLISDIFDMYPQSIKFLAQLNRSVSVSQILTQLSDELREKENISPSSWSLELKFEEDFAKMGLISKNSTSPNSFKSNIHLCHNEYMIPRSVAMNYLKEDINSIKSACKSLTKYHDPITGFKLPLVKQCTTGVRTKCIRITEKGKTLWQYLKSVISSDEADSLKKISQYQGLVIELQNMKLKANSGNNELKDLISDANFRIKSINREKYPPKKSSKYNNQLVGLLKTLESHRISESGEYNYQRHLTALEAIKITHSRYNYLRDVRNWINLTKNEIENTLNDIKGNLRIFSSLRSEKDFKLKLENLNNNVENLLKRVIVVYEVVGFNDWNASNGVSKEKSVHLKDLPINETFIPTTWIAHIAEAFSDLQKDQNRLIPQLEELEIIE